MIPGINTKDRKIDFMNRNFVDGIKFFNE